ncbi:Protein of uncharacterised function (DUF2971) [Serratia quinivorans]|uniref:DUF2971 domain-containing protein n=1 Tax=Serratia quinivorans TaxID=137545 RepID=UPI00217974B8|nr:DUF2971 domain-containing protein [Serratia quinivorans]CAI0847524.1 Protein of uncharacterised function (DUF2971) [Serratia quinivorans]CAI0889475.1 Protein of uncharacterised function (DUF2971) [Serratia quinivorans]CAI1680243.1 Protein of uncharacterised function (DUF2971) [Serratia quinivorans]CAI2080285.1 Protein of uncharacterised function (DUF2971) [Serratia quinivorans]CAI2438933.1 Protein of uncharacterised function (DUF2971) [Serratia quinivorans]
MALVYHYCSPQTFLHIIENNKIWLSSSNNMNDSAEGEWFSSAYHDYLKQNRERFGIGFCDAAEYKFSINNHPKYITCFSKDGDSLSQWRAYAQNGEGVVLGFDDTKLGAKGQFPYPNSDSAISLVMIDIEYQTKEGIFQLLDDIFSKCQDELDEKKRSFDFAAMSLGFYLSVKNPAFHEEKEKRLIFSPLFNFDKNEQLYTVRNSVGELKHRISNGYLTSHFEYDINIKEALKEIILGPRNKFSDHDVNNLLGFNGLKKITVKKSAATYR